MADEVVSKRGWLKKQSSIVKSWNLKWFVIRGGKMHYYAKDDEAKLQGTIELHSYKVSETLNRNEPEKWQFELIPDTKSSSLPLPESLLLWAASEQERQEWVFTIRRVLYKEVGGGVFGQRLEETMAYNAGSKVPLVVEDCIEYIRTYGLECEGILRLSGRTMLIKEICRKYDEGKRPNFIEDDIDIHTVASVLKMYFRELPEPVIPYNVFHQYLDIATSFKFQSNNEENFQNLRRLLQKLPKHNYDLLDYLVTFLGEVDEKSTQNKMPMSNLGLIFGTHILRDENSSPELEMGTQHLTMQIVLALIKWHKDLFSARDPAAEQLPLPDLISFEDESDLLPKEEQPEPSLPPMPPVRRSKEMRALVNSAPGRMLMAAGDLLKLSSQAAASDAAPDTCSVQCSALTGVSDEPDSARCTLSHAAKCVDDGTPLSIDRPSMQLPAVLPRHGAVEYVQQSAATPPVSAVPNSHSPVTSADPSPLLAPPPAITKRQKSLSKKGERPAVLPPQPTSAPESPSSSVWVETESNFCSYIKSPTMTPCLEHMPTSVGDLQALVFSLKLLLREQEGQLSQARSTIAELRTSNEEAVRKVVQLQATLVEYESQFGSLKIVT